VSTPVLTSRVKSSDQTRCQFGLVPESDPASLAERPSLVAPSFELARYRCPMCCRPRRCPSPPPRRGQTCHCSARPPRYPTCHCSALLQSPSPRRRSTCHRSAHLPRCPVCRRLARPPRYPMSHRCSAYLPSPRTHLCPRCRRSAHLPSPSTHRCPRRHRLAHLPSPRTHRCPRCRRGSARRPSPLLHRRLPSRTRPTLHQRLRLRR